MSTEEITASADLQSTDIVTDNTSPLDLTSEVSTIREFNFSDKPYDPRPHEDAARRRIAYSLIALLFIVVILIFILLATGIITVSDIKEFSVILGPLVTLVSAATGFYYGTKSK